MTIHIFDPDLDNQWIINQENNLEGLLRAGVWQCEVECNLTFGWSFGTLDTYKQRQRKETLTSFHIDNFDIKYRHFDGTITKQSLLDRYESSFYEDIPIGTQNNLRINGSYILQPYIDYINQQVAIRPDLAYAHTSPYRWWTLYRTQSTFTVKYPFGGTLQTGWWAPPAQSFILSAIGLQADLINFDNEGMGFKYLASDTNILYIKSSELPGDWWSEPYYPPTEYPLGTYPLIGFIEKSEFSLQWATYNFSYDWTLSFDSGNSLDLIRNKWKKFYCISEDFQKFATLEILATYGDLEDYTYSDNIEFDSDSVVEMSSRFDSRQMHRAVELDTCIGVESDIPFTFRFAVPEEWTLTIIEGSPPPSTYLGIVNVWQLLTHPEGGGGGG
jgi:hypothetical protein